jgi:hypothetical protein
MMFGLTSLIAETMPKLVTDGGSATSIGVWVLMAIVAMAAGLFLYNQVLTAKVNQKLLSAPPQQSMVQPLIVAMEEKFVTVPHFNEKHLEVRQQLKEVRAYAHDEVHNVRGDINAIRLAGELRDTLMHKLDERSLNQGRVIEGMNAKMDRLVDRFADKVEELIRNGSLKR